MAKKKTTKKTGEVYQLLTPKQKAKYITEAVEFRCPYCGCEDVIEYPEQVRDGTEHRQTNTCESCGRAWTDVFVLTRVEDAEQLCLGCEDILFHNDVTRKDAEGNWYHARCYPK